jgi:GNAT superfamily N-acetyltransferase
VIRLADDRDVAALAALRRLWTEELYGGCDDPDYGRRFAAWFAAEAPRRVIWLAEADRRPVGMVNVSVFERMPRPGRPPSRWGYLANVFVLAAYRNRGIGRRLMTAVLEHAHANGWVRVVLSPAERAVPFYTRLGFGPADLLMVRTFDT